MWQRCWSFIRHRLDPGFPASDADKDALPDLADIPIFMFVGGDDGPWLERMTETRDTLESLGAAVRLSVRAGEGHIISSLSDGVDIFDSFDSVRVLQPNSG